MTSGELGAFDASGAPDALDVPDASGVGLGCLPGGGGYVDMVEVCAL